jgi:hypothetical protein
VSPQVTVFAADPVAQGEVIVGGTADALALGDGDTINIIVNWKSDVDPSAAVADLYRAQLRDIGVWQRFKTKWAIWFIPGANEVPGLQMSVNRLVWTIYTAQQSKTRSDSFALHRFEACAVAN